MAATTTKEPRTFAELDTDPRQLSPLFIQARKLAVSHRELTEAECVKIVLGVHQHRGRYFTDAGMWGVSGDLHSGRVTLFAGDRPTRGDHGYTEPEEAPPC